MARLAITVPALMVLALMVLALLVPAIAIAGDVEVHYPWPDLTPGETERATGTALPRRPAENPPITRVVDIRCPTFCVIPPSTPANGTAVLVLPGGGFGKVFPDLEGAEAAEWLGGLGYGSRSRTNSNIGTWSDRAVDWLRLRKP